MDIPITITKFQNLYNTTGERIDFTWNEFKECLRSAEQTTETVSEYQSMTDKERTKAKDVGGYIAGILEHNSRERNSKVISRYALVIDADTAKIDDADAFDATRPELYFAHTTHTSTEDNPRLRWIFPLSRPVSSEEYTVLIREVQTWIGNGSGDTGDESTDEPKRLMFWPSYCKDSTFQYWEGGYVVLNPDDYLTEADSPIHAPDPPEPKKEEPTENRFSIPSGSRNTQIASYAGTLRHQGLDYEGILYAVTDYNERYCDDPLPETEILTIVRSICKYSAGDLVSFQQRDAKYDFNDIADFSSVPEKRPKIFQLESLAHLDKRFIPEPKWYVKDMITTGVTMLASPPKLGKSFLCMDLVGAVGTGDEFLGFSTTKSDAIYFALEDGDFRLQRRSRKVNSVTREIPENVFVNRDAVLLKDGFLEMLDNTLKEEATKNVGLIVIDTLQKIRGVAGKTEGVYGFDYREVGDIQKFALDHNIAIILVHHTNKGSSYSDPVEKLNGSTGITGAADSYMILEKANRNDPTTKLHVLGRDVDQKTYIIRFNSSTCRWENLGEERNVKVSEEQEEVERHPVTRLVQDKLDELEESKEQEETEVSWEAGAKEIEEELMYSYGDSIDCRSIGKWISKKLPYFKLLDPPIEISFNRQSNERTIKFVRMLN